MRFGDNLFINSYTKPCSLKLGVENVLGILPATSRSSSLSQSYLTWPGSGAGVISRGWLKWYEYRYWILFSKRVLSRRNLFDLGTLRHWRGRFFVPVRSTWGTFLLPPGLVPNLFSNSSIETCWCQERSWDPSCYLPVLFIVIVLSDMCNCWGSVL